ncbi:unnamed protein product [Diabrotica balteata]|uniref:BPTI/Kunitz inhibitor domain-containing protein n=1 Tax=Diabrotica balteata TaxID=107213 RepID=A0A9N9XGW6_DIABA|nr:unnamed protein product [Diabrotica balteata]
MKFIFLLFLVAAVNARLPSPDSLARIERPFTVADCYLPHETEPCEDKDKGTILVYKWDVRDNNCVQALYYVGCKATKNLFGSYQECLYTAGPVCQRSPVGVLQK